MKRTLITAVLLTASLAALGQSDGTTGFNTAGNDLIETCRPGNALELLACYSYIHGVLDGFLSGAVWNTTPHADGSLSLKQLCIPDGVTNGELVKVILAFADKHPANLHTSATNLITMAVQDAWGSTGPGKSCKQ